MILNMIMLSMQRKSVQIKRVEITLDAFNKRDELANDEQYGRNLIEKQSKIFCGSLLEVIRKGTSFNGKKG